MVGLSLKSRLLLPDPPEDEPNAADMAEALKFQLLRWLEAMQKASKELFVLPQLGTEIFLRGDPEHMPIETAGLLPAFVRFVISPVRPNAAASKNNPMTSSRPTRLFSSDTLVRMRRMIGSLPDWGTLQAFLPAVDCEETLETKSAMASTFAANSEMVKTGELDIRQINLCADLFRRRSQTEEPLT